MRNVVRARQCSLLIKRAHHYPVRTVIGLANIESLVLHYPLDRAPRLVIEAPPKARIWVDNWDTREHPRAVFYNGRWVLDPDYGIHSVKVEKPFYPAYETEIELTPSVPYTKVIPAFPDLNSSLVLTTAEQRVRGWLRGEGIEQRIHIMAGDSAHFGLPYGTYRILAHSPGLRRMVKEVDISSEQVKHLEVNPLWPPKDLMIRFSYLYPGLGQWFTRQPLKALLMMGPAAWAMSTMLHSGRNYNKESNRYAKASDAYLRASSMEEIERTRIEYRRSRSKLLHYHHKYLAALYITAACYAWSILDIRHNYPDQDEGLNLSLSVNSVARKPTPMLHVSWTFRE